MKIKTLLFAAAMALGVAGAAQAADAVGYQIITEEVATLPGVKNTYIGVTGGVSERKAEKGTVGAVVGRKLNDNVTVEGQYEYRAKKDHLVSGNVLIGQQFGNVTPYALGGVGYRWSEESDDSAVYVVGGGAKFALSDTWEVDGRYRYVAPFGEGQRDNRYTLGLNYKF